MKMHDSGVFERGGDGGGEGAGARDRKAVDWETCPP